MVSLADRRKQRGSMLDAENDDMLNKLKDEAEFLEREGAGKRNALEEIAEDPDSEDDMEGSPMKRTLGQTIEPDQNMSYMIGNMSPEKPN